MVSEATIEDGVPRGEGWFVVNARETRWQHNELGAYCGFGRLPVSDLPNILTDHLKAVEIAAQQRKSGYPLRTP